MGEEANRMNLRDGQGLRVPSLQEETENQQRQAIFAMTPAMIVILGVFGILGFGKYWDDIPSAGGTIWAIVYTSLLLAALYPRWKWHKRGAFAMSSNQLRLTLLSWAFALGSSLAFGAYFGVMNDDISGRVTFAIMVFGLGGIVLSVTYMVPVVAMGFFLPIAIVVLAAVLQVDHHVSWVQKVGVFLAFSMLFGLLIRFNWRLFQSGVRASVEREQHRYEVLERRAEMDAARRIQMGLLPSAGQALKEEARYDLAAQLEPAREMTGDLYDFFMLDADRLFFLVGDVCGKGVTSSLLMAITKTVVKNAVLRREQKLGSVMTEVNTELMRAEHEGQFVTCVAGILDLSTGVIVFTNAGHEPLLLLRSDGQIDESPLAGGPPFCTVDGVDYETGIVQLQPGDGLLAVSDGVTEAELDAGKPLGQNGLTALLKTLPNDSRPSIIIEKVQSHLAISAVGTPDDRTLLAIRYHSSQV
jgi:serine phosphatase RsbU (regulator of sigma subunit)